MLSLNIAGSSSVVSSLTPWQLWTALPFVLPTILRSHNDAQALPERFPALTEYEAITFSQFSHPWKTLFISNAPYLVLRAAEWLQAELLTGVDSAGLAGWAPVLLAPSQRSFLVQLYVAHVSTHLSSVFSAISLSSSSLVPSLEVTHSAQLARLLASICERNEFDASTQSRLSSMRRSLGEAAFSVSLLELLFRQPSTLREELFHCTLPAHAECIAWALHLCSVSPSTIVARLAPMLAELDHQPRGLQLAVLLGSFAAFDARYTDALWPVLLVGLPRSLATPAEACFPLLATMLLAIGYPPEQSQAASALRSAGLEHLALLAFNWNDKNAQAAGAAFYSIEIAK